MYIIVANSSSCINFLNVLGKHYNAMFVSTICDTCMIVMWKSFFKKRGHFENRDNEMVSQKPAVLQEAVLCSTGVLYDMNEINSYC